VTEPKSENATDSSIARLFFDLIGEGSTASLETSWDEVYLPFLTFEDSQSPTDLLKRIEQLEMRVAELEAKGI